MYKILSIDGGGIRGVIPASLLTYIEKNTGKAVADLFDLIVGTSTGGIITAALTVQDSTGRPKFSAEDLVKLYSERGDDIFEHSLWRDIKTGKGAFDERYPYEPLERILKEYLGDNTLTDCLKPIIVTSYDIERRQPYFFKTSKAKGDADRNHYLRDAIRATSAAPTYFEPAPVYSLSENNPTRRVLVDGGVFVNNPAMSAYAEAIHSEQAAKDILLVSLGTGMTNRKIPYEYAKNWGALEWARPIIGVMMDGQADAADHYLEQLLPGKDSAEKSQRYFRFDTTLKSASDDLDDTSADNIKNLKETAQEIIRTQQKELDKLLNDLGEELARAA